MSYFVTGATGFIGRHLVRELIDHREGEIFVLARQSRCRCMEALVARWGSGRVTPVVGDLGEDALGVDPEWVGAAPGRDRALSTSRRSTT